MAGEPGAEREILYFARGEWLPGSWSAEARRFVPALLLGLYFAHRDGVRLTKREGAALMNADAASSGPKYIALAEQAGYVVIERKPEIDRRKDFLSATPLLIALVDQELAKLRTALLVDSPSERIGQLSSAVAEDERQALRIFGSPAELRPFALDAAQFVEEFHQPGADRRKILNDLVEARCLALSADVNLRSSSLPSLVASLDRRWHIVESHQAKSASVTRELLQTLFFYQAQSLKLVPGTHHLAHRFKAHPDDLQAAYSSEQALAPLSSAPTRPVPGLFSASSFAGCVLVFGGSSSNVLARLLLEERAFGSSGGFVPVDSPAIALRYVASSTADEPRIQITANEYEPNWGLEDKLTGETLLPKTDGKGRLLKDLLLVTVLPNFLDKASYKKGDKIVLLAGAHGVGTLASSKLWTDEALLQIISDKVRGATAWQAVIETGVVRHTSGRPRADSLGSLVGYASLEMGERLDERFLAGSNEHKSHKTPRRSGKDA